MVSAGYAGAAASSPVFPTSSSGTVSSGSSSSAGASSASSASSASGSGAGVGVGAIAGGVVGGLLVLGAVIGGSLFATLRAKKSRQARNAVVIVPPQWEQMQSDVPPMPIEITNEQWDYNNAAGESQPTIDRPASIDLHLLNDEQTG